MRRSCGDGSEHPEPPAGEAGSDHEEWGGPGEVVERAATWQERLTDAEGLGCRITTFHALSKQPGGLFRVMPVALRFLRVAGGRTQEAVGAALGVESGTVEGIERGCVIPVLSDLDAWLDACECKLDHFVAAHVAAQSLWPPELATLTVPQFWGPLAPSAEDFETARQLIERLGGRGAAAAPGSVPPNEVGAWLVRFFGYLDEEVSPHLSAVAPRAGLEELTGDEPLTVSRWWSRTLALWFNLYVACQAPVGCRFLRVKPDPGS